MTFLFSVTTFLWLLITALSALVYSRTFFPASWRNIFSIFFHPQWSTVTTFLILALQWWWIRKLVGTERTIREQSSRRYLSIFLLIAVMLTGFATNMGFLPFFFHQFCVWPLIAFGVWDFIKTWRAE